MKKKIFKAALLVAVVAVAGLGAFKAQAKKTTLSDIMLANVEALTRYEIPEVEISCSKTCSDGIGRCWKSIGSNFCIFSGYQTDNCICY